MTVTVTALEPDAFEAAIPALSALVVDAVDGGASVNFLTGVTLDEAAGWWGERAEAVRDGTITAFVATERATGTIVGSTILIRSRNPNSPHRAEIGKVIVLRSHRGRGLARALMTAAEEMARAEGRWLLFLDTVTGGPAAEMYAALGWSEGGTIPDWALLPDGTPWPATWFYKDLR